MRHSIWYVVLAGLSLGSLSACETTEEARIPMPEAPAPTQEAVAPQPTPIPQRQDASLDLSLLTYPIVYDDPEQFAVDVFFQNRGERPLVIMPAFLRRHYTPMDDAGAVTYVPLPAPQVSPWRDAVFLGPQESTVVRLVGMSDGEGIWHLARGFYRFSVSYVIEDEFNPYADPQATGVSLDGAELWRGEVQSDHLTVRYRGKTEDALVLEAARVEDDVVIDQDDGDGPDVITQPEQ